MVESGRDEAWSLEFPPPDLGFPFLLESEYRHSMPQVRHRVQAGFALEHLTFARKQPSQDSRKRGRRGLPPEVMVTRVV